MKEAVIRSAQPADSAHIDRMCRVLWPGFDDADAAQLLRALEGKSPGMLPATYLVAVVDDPVGFAEVTLRSHADGCDPAQPVGYLEGWFVDELHRGKGIGGKLVRAAEDWARAHGCREFASDTWIAAEGSQQAHEALGFEVVDRCVHYRKSL